MDTTALLAEYRTSLLAQEKSLHTVKLFVRDAEKLLTNYSEADLLNQITPHDLDRFLVQQGVKVDGTNKHSNTQNRTKIALRSFFGWALRSGYIDSSPAAHLKMKRVDRLPPVYLTESEEQKLLATIQNYATDPHWQRDYTILQLLLNTGIRVAELVQLDLTDLEGKLIIIRRQKGGNPIRKFLPRSTRQFLTDYINGERDRINADTGTNALFISQAGKRLQARSIQLLTQKWVTLAGIVKPVTPHKLRHTFATSLYAKSKDILVVQKALGHRSVINTQIYAHVNDQTIEEAVENRLSSLPSEFQT